ncbi:hypothetical protein GCM10027037_23880 [Mucilaginibacter koreensis]
MVAIAFLLTKNPENTLAVNSGLRILPPSSGNSNQTVASLTSPQKQVADWKAPDESVIPAGNEGKMIAYGRNLIAHTSLYLGPKGMVAQISNGMNCQNCHLDAGTKFWGNNYAAVFSTYPKFRARSGTKETIVKRVSDCFERSLNGNAPDSTGKEMKAIVAYMKFLGANVKKGTTPNGAGLEKLPYLNRAANAAKGAILYQAKCVTCHGTNGEGTWAADKKSYTYPPLWGGHSYNDGAGLYRISNFAGYIKNNMPYGASYQNPQLTNEEAWDIAAFVNSQPRPHKNQQHDWKDISKKPVDFPFGPYADRFSEKQHKYGPFQPIKAAHKKS